MPQVFYLIINQQLYTMMLTVIFQNVHALRDVYAFSIDRKDVDFSAGDVLKIKKTEYKSGLITYKGEYRVVYITNRTYQFVNTLTGELTNNPAILHRDEVPTITKNDYEKL